MWRQVISLTDSACIVVNICNRWRFKSDGIYLSKWSHFWLPSKPIFLWNDPIKAYSTSKEGLNSSIVESVFRAQPLPLEDFYYNVTESTNTSVTVYWTPPPANETIYDYFEISVPGKFTVRMEKNETFITMDGLKNDFYTLNAWTKTNDPFPSHSSPKESLYKLYN